MNKNHDMISIILCLITNVIKQWKIIIIIACLCASCFDIIKTWTYSPTYKASMTCAIVNDDGNGLSSEDANKANKSISYLLNSHYMKNMVNETLEQDYFLGYVSLNMMANTNFCMIDVYAPTQKDAYFELKALINAYEDISSMHSFGYHLNKVEDMTFSNVPLNTNSHIFNYTKGFVVGFALSTLCILLYHYFNDTIKSSKEVNEKIDVRLYSKLPKEIKKYQKRHLFKKEKQAILVSQFKTGFSYIEAMNKLASKVEETCKKNHEKTILITSSLENEGKSSVAVNLAISLAKNKKKVLVIDGDLRKPALHKIFEKEIQYSLVDVLEKKCQRKEAIISLEKEHIDVIFSKAMDNPQDIFSKTDFHQFIQSLKKDYDYIIVDSAPSRYMSDTSMIASCCDLTFMVVRQDLASAKVINDTIYQLNSADANVVGVIYNSSVYNPVQVHQSYGYRYGYYRYRREGRS